MNDVLDPQAITPGILSMLPLFYIGWSDSVLSPSEMKIIHKRIKKLTFLTEEDKQYLVKYTDPLHPPSDETFKHWVDILKSKSADMDMNTKASLADVGLELAMSATGIKEDGTWKLQKRRRHSSKFKKRWA